MIPGSTAMTGAGSGFRSGADIGELGGGGEVEEHNVVMPRVLESIAQVSLCVTATGNSPLTRSSPPRVRAPLTAAVTIVAGLWLLGTRDAFAGQLHWHQPSTGIRDKTRASVREAQGGGVAGAQSPTYCELDCAGRRAESGRSQR